MTESTYDKVDSYDKKTRKDNWEIAVGLNKVDGLTPSKYLKELIEESVEKNTPYKEIENKLNVYYKNNQSETATRECDIVSTRIAELLEDGSFTFSPIYLKSIHKYLFKDVFSGELNNYVGKFREYNITKKEPIIDGDTVRYCNYQDLIDYLEYDFEEERKVNYLNLSDEEKIKRISKFTSSIWQVHPFVEGNTRTTALFIEKYLRTKGFNVNNSLFKENSVYFRNSLVLSNYSNIGKKITEDYKYLYSFFDKLLFNQERELLEKDRLNKN